MLGVQDISPFVLITVPGCEDIGCLTRASLIHGIVEGGHHTTVLEKQSPHGAFLPQDFMFPLDFELITVLLGELVIQRLAVGLFGHGKPRQTHGPIIIKVLAYQTVGVTSCIGGKIISAGCHNGPVEKLGSWIMAVAVAIKIIES